jgi:imidazoleglycerol phosphate dehydratase HisB
MGAREHPLLLTWISRFALERSASSPPQEEQHEKQMVRVHHRPGSQIKFKNTHNRASAYLCTQLIDECFKALARNVRWEIHGRCYWRAIMLVHKLNDDIGRDFRRFRLRLCNAVV